MIHEYQCRTCGNIIEVKQGVDDSAKWLLYCPECKRMRPVKRIISKTSFILKGGAWAKDGYTRGTV